MNMHQLKCLPTHRNIFKLISIQKILYVTVIVILCSFSDSLPNNLLIYSLLCLKSTRTCTWTRLPEQVLYLNY